MNIALITLYDAYNCGSFLQAYAMQYYLESLGHNVDVLDCSTDKLRWLKRIAATSPRREYIKIKRRFAYGKAWKTLHLAKPINGKTYDFAIIGSDEIWNIENPYFEHWPQYFGLKLLAKKTIAYAPSIGYAKPQQITRNKELAQGIRGMDAVFARDNATAGMVDSIRGCRPELVCDPTLLIAEQWEKLEVPINVQSPYLMVYSYGAASNKKDELIAYAHKNGLRILSVGFDSNWADEVVIPTPFQFAYLVHHATAVFGTTFHISVFSSIYQVPFCTMSDMQKTRDFLSSTGQEWRMYAQVGDVEKILSDPRNQDKEEMWIPEKLIVHSKECIANELGRN